MAGNPARCRIGQRDYGQLDDGGALDQQVKDCKLERVNQILGVVEHDRLGRVTPSRLHPDQMGVKPVEAVRLGGRTVDVDLDRDHPLVADLRDCGGGRGVVPIMADEDRIVAVGNPIERCAEHRGDDIGLVPGGDQDHQPTGLSRACKPARVDPRVAAVDGYRPPSAPDKINRVDGQVVDREQQEAHRCEQGEFGGEALDQVGGGHWHAWTCRSGKFGVILPPKARQPSNRTMS